MWGVAFRAVVKATLLTLITFACLDLAGFALWAFSGQKPVDDVFVGTITTHVLRALVQPGTAQPE